MKTVRNIFSLLCAAIVCLTVASEGRAVENTLNPKQQSIIAISSFTANGDLEKLKSALNEGLDAGLTVNEIKEILVQLYAYAGFPRQSQRHQYVHGRHGRTQGQRYFRQGRP